MEKTPVDSVVACWLDHWNVEKYIKFKSPFLFLVYTLKLSLSNESSTSAIIRALIPYK